MPFIRGRVSHSFILGFFVLFLSALSAGSLFGQSGGNSGTASGTVTDGTGAVVVGAKVTIQNPVSGYSRTVVTDSAGKYVFANLPFNPYHLTISAQGFNPYTRDLDVRSTVGVTVTDSLTAGGGATTVTVEASDLLENDVPWTGRSCFNFFLDRWAVDYRSAE